MNSEKKLKLILASLKDREIIKFFDVFSAHFSACFKKTIRQISFNCYESVCEFKNKIVSGYGKNSNEAYINSIRTLVQLLADDHKMHSILKQSMRLINSSSCDSDNKSVTEKSSKNHSMQGSIKPNSKKQTLKEQIFQYLNLDNLKISNPNVSRQTKAHEKYMNQSVSDQDQLALDQILKRNQQLEKQIQQAKKQNHKLKNQYMKEKQHKKQKSWAERNQNSQSNFSASGFNEQVKQKNTIKDLVYQKKPRDSYDPLKTKTNQYLNMSHDTKLRSISVESSSQHFQPQTQTQKYLLQSTSKNDKKINIPKLNLQVLPNYHGKSNKSLNQSLMEIYEKVHHK